MVSPVRFGAVYHFSPQMTQQIFAERDTYVKRAQAKGHQHAALVAQLALLVYIAEMTQNDFFRPIKKGTQWDSPELTMVKYHPSEFGEAEEEKCLVLFSDEGTPDRSDFNRLVAEHEGDTSGALTQFMANPRVGENVIRVGDDEE